MGRIAELPRLKPRSRSRRRGLRKLSPDLISKASDETATQVTRIGLTFLGTAAFCLLSLDSPDSALLGGIEKINVRAWARCRGTLACWPSRRKKLGLKLQSDKADGERVYRIIGDKLVELGARAELR
jgi:hypothetical protein